LILTIGLLGEPPKISATINYLLEEETKTHLASILMRMLLYNLKNLLLRRLLSKQKKRSKKLLMHLNNQLSLKIQKQKRYLLLPQTISNNDLLGEVA
jgi:hypothetical protein